MLSLIAALSLNFTVVWANTAPCPGIANAVGKSAGSLHLDANQDASVPISKRITITIEDADFFQCTGSVEIMLNGAMVPAPKVTFLNPKTMSAEVSMKNGVNHLEVEALGTGNRILSISRDFLAGENDVTVRLVNEAGALLKYGDVELKMYGVTLRGENHGKLAIFKNVPVGRALITARVDRGLGSQTVDINKFTEVELKLKALPLSPAEIKIENELRAFVKDPGQKKFRRDLEVCLIKRDLKCLLRFTHSDYPEAFASLIGVEGGEDVRCSPDPDKANFTPKEAYKCLFEPGGKALLKHFRVVLKTGDAFLSEEGIYVLSDDLLRLKISKVDNAWRIVGLAAD